MRARLAASAVLVALLAIGTTGCTFITPQATTMHYDPSDGIGTTIGDVKINNALLVTNDGTSASLIISIQNNSEFGEQIEIQYEDASNAKVNDGIFVNSRSVVSLGADGPSTVTLTGIDAPAGSLFPVFIRYADNTGKQLWLPVLAAEGEYSDLAPTVEP